MTCLAMTGLLVAGGTGPVFAASTTAATDDCILDSSYGYLVGQCQQDNRHAQYDVAASFTTDAQREAYFEAQGIGSNGAHGASQYINAGALVAADIIDQETADTIMSYASQKHDKIHAQYENRADMTPEQRHAFYDSFEDKDFWGNPSGELLNAGVITQEQADAINSYLSSINKE